MEGSEGGGKGRWEGQRRERERTQQSKREGGGERGEGGGGELINLSGQSETSSRLDPEFGEEEERKKRPGEEWSAEATTVIV